MSVPEAITTSERVYLPAYASSTTKNVHIYFVTGNPGCISYYHTFLTLLRDALRPNSNILRATAHQTRETTAKWSWTIHGRSLAGMVKREGKLFSLQDQIGFIESDILDSVVPSCIHGERQGTEKQRVILMGHSVGAYIAMEVLRRVRSRQAHGEKLGIEIVGLVGLFPTITDIGLSPRGVIATPLLCSSIGLQCITSLANGLLWPWSRAALQPLVRLVTGMDDLSSRTTTEFLTSPTGVAQALFMAADEMREIKADKWDEEIWGSATPSKVPAAKLAFLFGENDHWVRDSIRDDLIKARGRTSSEQWKAEMVVDRSGISHAFCIKHNLQTVKLAVPLLLGIVQQLDSS